MESANLSSSDRTLEIGAGLGALTQLLAERCFSVTTIEIDDRLLPILNESLSPYSNVTVRHDDFLEIEIDELLDQAFGIEPGVLVANIPYYITTPIIERVFLRKERFRTVVLLVQKEVAERLRAKPGTKDYSALSIFAQYHAKVELVGTVSKGCFFPRPEVDSAYIRLTPINPGAVEIPSEEVFFQITRSAFGQRRKTLLNAMAGSGRWEKEQLEPWIRKAGIDPGIRGEELGLEEYAALTRVVCDETTG